VLNLLTLLVSCLHFTDWSAHKGKYIVYVVQQILERNCFKTLICHSLTSLKYVY